MRCNVRRGEQVLLTYMSKRGWNNDLKSVPPLVGGYVRGPLTWPRLAIANSRDGFIDVMSVYSN